MMSQGVGNVSDGIFVFEANNEDFKNRKRAAKACASCQKRKKRCSHTFTKTSDQQAEKDTAEKVLPQLILKEPVKFVGDLNPESVLTDLQRSTDSPRYSRIGVWVEASRLEQEQNCGQHEAAIKNGSSSEADPSAKKSAAVQRYAKVERSRRTLTGHQKNYLQAVGALRVLPKATQNVLVKTYVECIDPLLPVIDCKKLLQEYNNGEASVFLIQAICLVACKTVEAIPHLRLNEDGPLMEPIAFARTLHTGLDAAMKADLEADRFTKVQIMTLMSLHNDGPGGIEESSVHLVMAIHDAQTTGLHINTPGRSNNDQPAMLWWTLWTLDKFNACLGGRPLMIAERDIDIDRPSLEPNVRSQTLHVWLAMGDLLDKIIEFYRPKIDPVTSGWEGDFPSFEELTRECSMNLLGESQRNLLEVCYNIIGILACRAGGPMSVSYNRRIRSADRIQQLTAEGRQAHLPPLPLVPYAISLSLTVAYRGLRDSHCDPVKTQSDLAARCGILESANKTWWTADAMAKLGRKALKSIQQAPQSEEADQPKTAAGLDVGDALEAEVVPCKFGPFNATRSSSSPTLQNGTAGLVRTNSGESNGLEVLSQAAATLGQSRRRDTEASQRTTRNESGPLKSYNTSVTSNPSKRVRYDNNRLFTNQRNFSPHNSTSHRPASTPSSTQMSTMTTTTPQTPLSNSRADANNNRLKMTNPDVFQINPDLDPFCATHAVQPDFDTAMSVASALQPSMNGANVYNPRLTIPLHTNYNGNVDLDMYDYSNLDTLFDGFFDLSMPTMFEDPLFEGQSYDLNLYTGGHSGGPSGAPSVDMSYGPTPAQRNNGWQGTMGMHEVQMNMTGLTMGPPPTVPVNKVSPPGAISGVRVDHWCWDEEDY